MKSRKFFITLAKAQVYKAFIERSLQWRESK